MHQAYMYTYTARQTRQHKIHVCTPIAIQDPLSPSLLHHRKICPQIVRRLTQFTHPGAEQIAPPYPCKLSRALVPSHPDSRIEGKEKKKKSRLHIKLRSVM
jgi:hypothetical protein